MSTKLINSQMMTMDEAVTSNLGLIYKVSKKFLLQAKTIGLEHEDLEQIGAYGLMKAFQQFDDSLGYTFSTYATTKIYGEITAVVNRKCGSSLNFPADIKIMASHVIKENLENISIPYVMKRFEITEYRAKLLIQYLEQHSALSIDNDSLKDGTTHHETLGKFDDYTNLLVNDFLSTLTNRELVICKGLMKGYSKKAISTQLNVGPSAITNKLKVIKLKLQQYQECS